MRIAPSVADAILFFFFLLLLRPPSSTLFPYTTLFRSVPSLRAVERRISLSLQYAARAAYAAVIGYAAGYDPAVLTIRSVVTGLPAAELATIPGVTDRKSTRLNSSHGYISYAVFCLKKK